MARSIPCTKIKFQLLALSIGWALLFQNTFASGEVNLKSFARIEGVNENSLVGYGLVVGLAGSGDTARNKSTSQSIVNTLNQFGITVDIADINSRNVAAVTVTASLSPFSSQGDVIDVNVSSIGDARSLAGGTLLMTPLKAVDNKVYVVAQGQVSVGGYSYDYNGNVIEKNHPTVGVVTGGGAVEKTLDVDFVSKEGVINIILLDPNFVTANRLQKALNEKFSEEIAFAKNAGRVSVTIPKKYTPVAFIAEIQNLKINLDISPRVVVNERTGTVVSGGDVRIDNVTVSHGNLQVVISTEFAASQPSFVRSSANVSTVIVPNTKIDIDERSGSSVTLPSGSSIDDLIKALAQVKTSTRDVIGILQSIKKAGALQAELIIQ